MNNLQTSIALFAIALLTAAFAAGCGGGDSTASDTAADSDNAAATSGDATSGTEDSGGTTSSDGGDGDGSRLTKAEFIKRADAICERIDEEQLNRLQRVVKEDPSIIEDDQAEAELAISVGMPLIKQQAAEIEELGAPAGDEEEVQTILDAMTEAAEGVEREVPPSLIGEFREVNKLAERYGFDACSEVL